MKAYYANASLKRNNPDKKMVWYAYYADEGI